MEAAPHPWPALGVLLMRDGLVSKEELEEILTQQHDTRQQRVSGRRLGEILIRRGRVTPTQVAKLVAEQYELPFVDFDVADLDLRVATVLKEDQARRLSALPISRRPDGTYLLAIADPGTVLFSEELRGLLGSVPQFAVVGPDAIENAIDHVFSQPLVLEPGTHDELAGGEGALLDFPPGGPVIGVFSEPELEVPRSDSSPLLGALLMRDGFLTTDELETALAQQRLHPELRLGEILVEQSIVTPATVARLLAEQYEMRYFDLGLLDIDRNVASRLPDDVARRLVAVPIAEHMDGSLDVAISDPTRAAFSDELHSALGVPLTIVMASPDAILSLLDDLQAPAFSPAPVTEHRDEPPEAAHGGDEIADDETYREHLALVEPMADVIGIFDASESGDSDLETESLATDEVDVVRASDAATDQPDDAEVSDDRRAGADAVFFWKVPEEPEAGDVDLLAIPADRDVEAPDLELDSDADAVARDVLEPLESVETFSPVSTEDLEDALEPAFDDLGVAEDADEDADEVDMLDDVEAEDTLAEPASPSATDEPVWASRLELVDEVASVSDGDEDDGTFTKGPVEVLDDEAEGTPPAETQDLELPFMAVVGVEEATPFGTDGETKDTERAEGAVDDDGHDLEVTPDAPEPVAPLPSLEAVFDALIENEGTERTDVRDDVVEATASTDVVEWAQEETPELEIEAVGSRLDDDAAAQGQEQAHGDYDLDPEHDEPFDIEQEYALDTEHVVDHEPGTEQDDDFGTEPAPRPSEIAIAIDEALAAGASTLHFSPAGADFSVRARVDGVVTDIGTATAGERDAAIARLGALGVRAHTAATSTGEKTTLFLRDQAGRARTLDELLQGSRAADALRSALEHPTGAIVVCAPVGSGTTTTLYTLLRELALPDRVVTTVEYPVEQPLDGVDQIEVNPALGITFASALREVRFTDPDTVMVGDVLDRDTAELALRNAREGRLVLAGFHAPSAATALTRLSEMGIDASVLGASLGCVVSQRLVRTVCADCRETYYASEAEMELLGRDEDEEPRSLTRGAGCESCGGTGFLGRTPIFEALVVTDELRELIGRAASAKKLQRAAVAGGMRTLRDEGIRLCLEGATTVAELERVLDLQV